MKQLNYIRVVLVEPTHPGNIGATARAMANMGVEHLAIVNPKQFPSEIANARAAGADWILDNAQVFNSLDEAIADCTLIFGTTARPRSIEWPSLAPWEAMQKATQCNSDNPVAILFGRESRGLKNDELDRCHHLIRIPVNDDFASLNLGSAVTVMLYELRKQIVSKSPESESESIPRKSETFANADDMQRLYTHMQTVLNEIEFIDNRSTKLMRKLIRLFNRATVYKEEVNILRGILSAVQYKVSNTTRNETEKN